MRKIFGVLGILLFILGVLSVVGGRVMVNGQDDRGGAVFWSGVAMVILGPTVSSSARNKTCSHCQARVQADASRCKRCGTLFS